MKPMNLLCTSSSAIATCQSINPNAVIPYERKKYIKNDYARTKIQNPEVRNSGKTRKSKQRSEKPNDAISPIGSSRYLLTDSSFLDISHESEPVTTLVEIKNSTSKLTKEDESCILIPSSTTRSHHQVVVLRVSLHCKGCAGKVRKHISRMEGVTSFSIDLPSKKVTVIGDVTPLSVLSSISRVKAAQFWPSSSSSFSSSSASFSNPTTLKAMLSQERPKSAKNLQSFVIHEKMIASQ